MTEPNRPSHIIEEVARLGATREEAARDADSTTEAGNDWGEEFVVPATEPASPASDGRRVVAADGGVEPVLLSAALGEEEEPVAWLLEGLLPAGGLAMLSGEGGVGKTTLAVNAGLLLSVGRGAFGWRSHSPAPVFHWLAEGNRQLFKRRIRVAADALGIEAPDFYVPSRGARPAEFRSPEFAATVARCAAVGIKLVVADPLGRFYFDDENDASRFRAGVVRPLLGLAEKHGIAFLVLHHFSKPTDGKESRHRIRGTSAMRDDPDLSLIFEHPKGSDRDARLLVFDKVRSGDEPSPLALVYSRDLAVYRVAESTDEEQPSSPERRKAEASAKAEERDRRNWRTSTSSSAGTGTGSPSRSWRRRSVAVSSGSAISPGSVTRRAESASKR